MMEESISATVASANLVQGETITNQIVNSLLKFLQAFMIPLALLLSQFRLALLMWLFLLLLLVRMWFGRPTSCTYIGGHVCKARQKYCLLARVRRVDVAFCFGLGLVEWK